MNRLLNWFVKRNQNKSGPIIPLIRKERQKNILTLTIVEMKRSAATSRRNSLIEMDVKINISYVVSENCVGKNLNEPKNKDIST